MLIAADLKSIAGNECLFVSIHDAMRSITQQTNNLTTNVSPFTNTTTMPYLHDRDSAPTPNIFELYYFKGYKDIPATLPVTLGNYPTIIIPRTLPPYSILPLTLPPVN